MLCSWKQVKGCSGGQRIPELGKTKDIPCQCGGLTGDVDDAAGMHGGYSR